MVFSFCSEKGPLPETYLSLSRAGPHDRATATMQHVTLTSGSSNISHQYTSNLNYPDWIVTQAVTHFSPFLRHEQVLLPHGFLDESLHLHRMNFKRLSGATSLSVMTGVSSIPLSFQPHCFGSRSAFVSLFQSMTFK